MKIFGYSERGAMNALFYGMAFDKENGKTSLEKFLKIAIIENADEYMDFNLYMECSLSDFGDPDLVIIAKKNEKEQDVFFIEAKVSHRGKFSLKKQRQEHNEYCGNGGKEKNDNKYDASNLFFQLRLKELFYSTNEKNEIKDNDSHDERIKCKKGKKGKENFRSIGKNEIVGKFARIIKEGDKRNSYYIAIIPKCEECQEPRVDKYDNIDIHLVPWECILKSEVLRKYLEETIKFNQVKATSQIFNNPLPNNE